MSNFIIQYQNDSLKFVIVNMCIILKLKSGLCPYFVENLGQTHGLGWDEVGNVYKHKGINGKRKEKFKKGKKGNFFTAKM